MVGHHPLYSGGKRIGSKDVKDINYVFKPIFNKHKVDAYICGHEHHLEYIKPEGSTHYFTSGSGSETRPVSIYPEYGKFAASQAGFMSFSITPEKVLVQTINNKGEIIFSYVMKK